MVHFRRGVPILVVRRCCAVQLDWIRIGTERPLRLVLDPRVTLVTAPAAELDRLVAALSRAWLDAGVEVGGSLSAAGMQVPLDPTTVLGLGLTGEGPPLVGPEQVPPPSPAGREVAEESLVEAARRVDRARAAVDAEVRRCEASSAAVEAGDRELGELRDRLASIDVHLVAADERDGLRAAERAAAVAAAELAGARVLGIDGVHGRVQDLVAQAPRWRLGTAPAGLDEVLGECRAAGVGPAGTVDALAAWSVQLAAGTAPVAAAAVELRAALDAVEQRWAAASAAGVEGDPEVVAAAAAAAAAGERAAALEELLASGVPGERVRVEIDQAHERTLSAGHRDRAAAVAAEEAVLGRYGFDSHLDYTIATSTRSVGDLVADRLAQLREELVAAAGRLAAARTSAAARLDALAAEREPLQRRAAELLGGWPDGPIGDALDRLPELPAELSGLPERLLETRAAAVEERRRAEEQLNELAEEELAAPSDREELVHARASVATRMDELAGLLEVARARTDEELVRHREAVADLARAEALLVAAESEADGSGYTEADVPWVVGAVLAALPAGAERPPLVLHDAFRGLAPRLAVTCLEALGREGVQVLYLTTDGDLAARWDEDPAHSPTVRLKGRSFLRRFLRRA